MLATAFTAYTTEITGSEWRKVISLTQMLLKLNTTHTRAHHKVTLARYQATVAEGDLTSKSQL